MTTALSLNRDAWSVILDMLPLRDIIALAHTCSALRRYALAKLSSDPPLWEHGSHRDVDMMFVDGVNPNLIAELGYWVYAQVCRRCNAIYNQTSDWQILYAPSTPRIRCCGELVPRVSCLVPRMLGYAADWVAFGLDEYAACATFDRKMREMIVRGYAYSDSELSALNIESAKSANYRM